MRAEPVLVALPGTMCSPAVFGPLALALAAEVTVDPVSWLTQPGPWDIPSVAARVARHIQDRWPGPVLVCGHSTGGAIALQLAVRHPELVAGLVLASQLTAVSQPVIVVHGRYDRARPPEQGQKLARALPRAEFRLLDSGHTPVYETPDAVAAAVRDVLRQVRERGATQR